MIDSCAGVELNALQRRINNMLAIFDSEHPEYINFEIDDDDLEKVGERLLAARTIIETISPLVDTVEELLGLDIPVDVFNERWDLYMGMVDEVSSEPDEPNKIGDEVMSLLKTFNGDKDGKPN